MIPGFPWRYVAAAAAGALLVALLIAGARAALARERAAGQAEGRAQVQAAWDAHQAQQVVAQAAADRKRAAEAFHQQRNVERSRENDAQVLQARAVADAGLRAERDRLLAALAARPAGDHPTGPGGDAAAGSAADDAAAVARQLLGDCSSRYAEVAEEAGKLSGQVIGLQGYVRAVQATKP